MPRLTNNDVLEIVNDALYHDMKGKGLHQSHCKYCKGSSYARCIRALSNGGYDHSLLVVVGCALQCKLASYQGRWIQLHQSKLAAIDLAHHFTEEEIAEFFNMDPQQYKAYTGVNKEGDGAAEPPEDLPTLPPPPPEPHWEKIHAQTFDYMSVSGAMDLAKTQVERAARKKMAMMSAYPICKHCGRPTGVEITTAKGDQNGQNQYSKITITAVLTCPEGV